MKKVFLPIIGTAIFIIAVGLLMKSSIVKPPSNIQTQVGTKTITVGAKTLSVEVADTESEKQKGLGGKSNLPQDSGMLFVFASKQARHTFWMKDMQFAIDIIWISNGKVVQIDKDAKTEPGVADQNLRRYSSQVSVDYILEVNAGFSDRNNIKVGDATTL